MVTQTITTDTDLALLTLNDITDIQFDIASNNTTVDVDASQFDGKQISKTVHIIGDDDSSSIIRVAMQKHTFSAAGWTFDDNGANIGVDIRGTKKADTITGPSILDGITVGSTNLYGGGGADILKAGSTETYFIYEAASDIRAGERITGGGSGIDGIQVNASEDGVYDFSKVKISSIRSVGLLGFDIDITAKFAGSQIAGAGISWVIGFSLSTEHLVVTGKAVDLSGITFFNWTAEDTILIKGTGKADVLKGSTYDDTFDGGAGNDQFFGVDASKIGDTVTYAHAKAGVTVDLSIVGVQQNTKGAGKDTFDGTIGNLTGSRFKDVLSGNSDTNILTGGKGADKLTGGLDADTFHFAKLSEKGDHITDFVSATDVIEIDHNGFANTVAGDLNISIVEGDPAPEDGEAWFLYNSLTGKLYFDADGTGSGKAVLLLTLDNGADINSSDVHLI